MAFTAALVAMGLTAAEAAAVAGAAGTAAAGAGAAAPAVAGAAGALGAGAGAGAAGMGAGGIGTLAGASALPEAATAIPAASSALPIGPAMGAGVEGGTGALTHSALPIGPAMGEGVEAVGSNAVSSSPSWWDKFFQGAKDLPGKAWDKGGDMMSDMAPKSTRDYLALGQTGKSMLGGGGSPPMPSPPPLMRPQGSAIPLGDPQRLKSLSVGGGGINPQMMAVLAKLLGRG
jgi:hypothetical protein